MTSTLKSRQLGHLDPQCSVLLLCDLQERFAPTILHFEKIVNNAERLLKAARILDVKVQATEQYPKVGTMY